jgi:uroporphyrinogen-III synthase/uroporphyrinogen III methyltransferase/synthase
VSTKPLAGRRILVTRSVQQAGKLSHALRELGGEPVEVPLIEIAPPESYAPLDKALLQLYQYNWLIFTSANTVQAIIDRHVVLGIGIVAPSTVKIAAIGPATAEAARNAGFSVAAVPESYVAESFVELLRGEVAGKRILLARAAVAREVIPDVLRAAGADVTVVDAYRNVIPESAPAMLREALASGIDAATFTSSSSVTHLRNAAERAGLAFPLAAVPAISIGPITSQTLRENNWPPAAEANPSDIPGLAAAVAAYFAGSQS